MIKYIPFLLLAGLLGEIATIIIAGRWLGVIPVLCLIVVSGFAGAKVVQAAGIGLAEAFRRTSLNRGPSAVDAIARLLVLGAGLLLILPGFMSDIAALGLLVPVARRWLASKIAGRTAASTSPRNGPFQGPVIEGEAVEIEGEIGVTRIDPSLRAGDAD